MGNGNLQISKKGAGIGSLSVATLVTLFYLHGYAPHAQAEENKERLTEIEQYIAVQQESNRLQAEYNRQLQQMQQQSYPPREWYPQEYVPRDDYRYRREQEH